MTLAEMDLTGNARLSKEPCKNCGKFFVYYPQDLQSGTPPKRCSRCKDVQQGRPSVVERRRKVNFYDAVKVKSLPGEWKKVSTGFDEDVSSFRIIFKGKEFGASWNGRIDIYSSRPIKSGEVVNIREMEVVHRVRIKIETRRTLEHGEVSIEKEVPLFSAEGKEESRTRRYLVFEPVDSEPKAHLVWVTAHTKTTLKGLGRQYWSKVTGAPITRWAVSGGARSERFHTDGVLAVVDEEHPIVVTTTGDIQKEVMYS